MTKKYLVKFSYQKHACPVEEVLFEDRDSIVVKFTDTHDGVKDTYSHAFVKGTEGGFLSAVDTAGGSSSLEEIVSRAVPPENRIDFTKPIELYIPSEGDIYRATFIGGMYEYSNNFSSWFIVRVPELGEILRPQPTSGWDKRDNLILVRGDGKTDVPEAIVRNVVEVRKPKLVLPLEVGKNYMCADGVVRKVSEIRDDVGTVNLGVKGDYKEWVFTSTGKSHLNPKYVKGFCVVEGPL